MSKVLLEVCCGSADDVIEAHRAGADRVELNSDLFHGGLTPTLGELIVAKRETGMRIMTMVRPREGGFCYTQAEFDMERTRIMAELARDAGRESVFHRAIDVTPDWRAALDALMDLGITRVLTSGQEPDVSLGTATVREMIEYAAGRIQILPGAGITARNMDRVIAETGCRQIHLAAHRSCTDASVANNRSIYYGGCLYPPEDRFQVIDRDYIGGMVGRLGEK